MPLRCVIVDDNASFRDEMRGLLEEEGIEVVGDAASVAQAVQRVALLRPDVVLVDIDLGGDSGFELARRMRADAHRDAPPDVILISTHDEREYADLIAASPAVGFLAKTELSAAAIRGLLGAVRGCEAGDVRRSDERPGR